MSQGLRIWDAGGNLVMDGPDRLMRFLLTGTVSVPSSATYGAYTVVTIPTQATEWGVTGYYTLNGTGFSAKRNGDIWKLSATTFAIRRNGAGTYTWVWVVFGY